MQKNDMRNRKKKDFGKSVISLMLVLVMVLGLVFQNVGEVQAGVAKIADAGTSETYKDEKFLGHPYSTEFAGRVWSDKTVTASEEGSELGVVFSALATSEEVSGQTAAPLDVVFVIDTSGSMLDKMSSNDNTKRIAATVKALNESIQKVMDMNEYTRVAVVAFAGTSEVLLSLGRYEKGNYSYTSNQQKVDITDYFSVSGNGETLRIHTKGNSLKTRTVAGGTNIQRAYYEGLNVLAAREDVTADIAGAAVDRVPAMILLSDGAPTFSSNSEYWWKPANNDSNGPGNNPSGNSEYFFIGNGFKALLTGAYMKNAVNKVYKHNVSIHTVGMGIDALSGNEEDLASVTLAPGDTWNEEDNKVAERFREAWDTYTSSRNSFKVDVGKSNGFGYEPSYYTVTHPSEEYDIYTANDKDALKNLVTDYHSANSAAAVVEVFDTIVEDIAISVPQVPTEIKKGETLEKGGYLTYTDPIGLYMQVNDVETLTYHGQNYSNPTKVDYRENGIGDITYTFSAEVTGSHNEQTNLNNILITVTTDKDGHQTMKAKIPAALIPLRVNTVKLNADGIIEYHEHNDEQPLRLKYTVGLRSDIYNSETDVINQNPVKSSSYFKTDAQIKAYQNYLKENDKDKDGKVDFYSNLYTGNNKVYENNKTMTLGDTTVEFEPSHTNKFYYIQEDMPIFKDEAMTEPVTTIYLDNDTTYYYKEVYYHNDDVVTKAVKRTGAQLGTVGLELNEDGQLVRTKGSVRLNKIHLFAGTKNSNETATASESYHPQFVHADGNADPYAGKFRVYLGNNGKIGVETTGNLSISKTVETAKEGLIPNADKEFEFKVDLDGIAGTYDYTVTNQAGQLVENGTIVHNGIIKLKDGQTATIVNLPPGTKYTVTETEVEDDGYTANESTKSGIIVTSETSNAVFVNKYDAEKYVLENVNAFKILSGRNWKATDEFIFSFTSTTANAPLPDLVSDGKVAVKSSVAKEGEKVAVDFGDITFTVPGTYNYYITELTPELAGAVNRIQGVSYTREAYELTVTVTDNGNGLLSAESVMKKVADPSGQLISEKVTEAVFTNLYEAESAWWGPIVYKSYTDHSDVKPLTDGMFQFELRPTGVYAAEAPMPKTDGDKGNVTTGTGADRVHVMTNTSTEVAFGMMEFTQADKGKTYTYRITETDAGVDGMTYDKGYIDVEVKIGYTGEGEVTVTPTYKDENGTTLTTMEERAFVNSYTPAPATFIPVGEKVLEGRELNSNDANKFAFTLTAANAAAKEVIGEDTVRKTTNGIYENDKLYAGKFAFDAITFTKPGTYTFHVKEVTPEFADRLPGVTYDIHTTIVTVTVKDEDGKLTVNADYDNSAIASQKNVTEKAVFVNNYVAEETDLFNFAGTKKLSGRDLRAGEFFFVTEPVDNAPMGDTSPGNPVKANGTFTVLDNVRFEKAGEYAYIIKENIPSEDQKLAGITYDENTAYKVVVNVTDNANGKLEVSSYKIYASADRGKTFAKEAAEAIVFHNKYKAESVTYEPYALEKQLANRELKAGEFTFKQEAVSNPGEGMKLSSPSTVTNDADGRIHFNPITFTEPGTYVVKIYEVAGKQDYIGYDDNEFIATFNVTDNGNGKLEVVRTYTGSRTFHNTYNTNDAVVTLAGAKWLEGRDWQSSDSFSFEIKAVTEGAPLPSKTTVQNEVPEVRDGSVPGMIKFAPISFSEEGTYQYVIKEVGELPGGVTTVSQDVTVTVKVVDNKEGQLDATVTYSGEGFVFKNTYKASAATVNVDGVKNVEIKDGNFTMAAGDFRFKLTPSANNPSSDPISETIVSNESDGSITFINNAVYKEPGTYIYDVQEISGQRAGISYDDASYTVELKVTDDKAGNLTVDKKIIKNGAGEVHTVAFDNVYNPSGTSVNISGKKVLEGKALEEGQFKFKIEAVTEGAPMPASTVVSNTAAGTFHFPAIQFVDKETHEGVYEYVITEVSGGEAGYTYDGSRHYITITVTSDEDGYITAKTAGLESLVFKNTYKAASVGGVVLKGKKVLRGRDLEAGEFIFQLLNEKGEVVDRANNAADGSFVFNSLTFDKVGTYYYTITEAKNGRPGVTYDENSYAAEIIVTDQGGYLAADVSYTGKLGGDSAVFENSYTTVPVSQGIAVTKILTGRDLREGEFTFVLKDAKGNVVEKVKNDAEGDVIFKEITYEKAGNYRYTISEEKGNLPSVTYDDTVYNVTVKVTDKDAVLSAEVKWDDKAPVFKNIYTLAPVSQGLAVTKKLIGRDLRDGEFTFVLRDEGNNVIAKETNDVFGNVVFDAITYNEAGTYTYTVSEEKGDTAGISYDDTVYKAVVTVTDKLDGTMSVDVNWGGNAPVFANTYKAAPVSEKLSVTKVLEGRELKDDEFTFVLKDANGEVVDKAKNLADGQVSFETITYDKAGTYTYTVSEEKGDTSGITYDDTVYNVTVKVTDNLDGTMSTKVDWEGKDPVFTNTYKAAPISNSISVTKVLEGRTLAENEFTFELKDAAGNVVGTAVNNNAGEVVFEAITYENAGTYVYTVSEKAGDSAGITYDNTVYTVTVSVTDNFDGTMSVEADWDGKDPIFTNVYKAAPVSQILEVTKVLTGRVLNEGEFTFVLKDADGNVIAKETNHANGNVTFDELTYEEAGTYVYTISEETGYVAGVTYDDNVFEVTVTVTDNLDGTMSAEVDWAGKTPVFVNNYKAAPVSNQISVTKELTGRDLKDDEFTFVLKDSAGNVISKVTNDADGNVVFDEIVYDRAGTYKYTVHEESGDAKYVTYDDTVYEVTVTVTDNLDGTMSVEVDWDGETPVFKNTYKKPEPPKKIQWIKKPQSPKTGDSTDIALYMVFELLAAAAIAIVIIRKKRNR